jgi:selenide,water dikinase
VAGGHTIIDDVPKYGMVVTGVVSVHKIVRNSTAREGDVLFLTKPVGNGVLVSANRVRKLFHRPPPLDEAIRWMTSLNRDAARAMCDAGASAATDITGYGLIGHLLEMCEGSGVGARISVSAVPVLGGARESLARGFRPVGTMRNVRTFRDRVRLNVAESELTLMCDAQTSGGLLIAIAPDRAAVLETIFDQGGLFYAKVGRVTAEAGHITLDA